MSSRKVAQEQRSSNIFGAPDNNKAAANRRRQDAYRESLHQQLEDDAKCRLDSVAQNRNHPLESRVEKYSVTMRKMNVEEEVEGEFVIGHEGKTAKDINRERIEYKSRLANDMQIKKEYLEHKEENDLKNRKPVERCFNRKG